ncbi:MAG: hypothetical protein JNK87_33400 [Bryobacterales bacterium]|nr:hypothetical protein [Bryobacterales bacterium]
MAGPPAAAGVTAVAQSQPKPAPPPPMAGPMELDGSFLRIPGGAKYPQLVRASWRYRVAFSAGLELPLLGWPLEGVRTWVRPEAQDHGSQRVFIKDALEMPRQGVLSRFSMVTSLMRLDRELKAQAAAPFADAPIQGLADTGRPTAAVVARHRGVRGFPIPLVGPRDPGMAGYLALNPAWFAAGTQARPLVTDDKPEETPASPWLPEAAFELPTELAEAAQMGDLAEPELQGGPIDALVVETDPLAMPVAACTPASPCQVGDPAWHPKYFTGPEPRWEQTAEQLRSELGGGTLRVSVRFREIEGEIDRVRISGFGSRQGTDLFWVPVQTFPVRGGVLKDLRERRHGTGIHVPQLLMRPLRPRVVMTDTGTPDDHELRQARESGVISISTLRSAGGFRR